MKKKSTKRNRLLKRDHAIQSFNNNIEINTQTPSTENCIVYRSQCPCDTHYDKQLIERNYKIPVDKLFDLIFGSNEFVRKYKQAQKFYDYTETEWKVNETTNFRERVLQYKVPYEAKFVGKCTISTIERQTSFHEVSGSHYVVETEVCNSGVKYSDTFALIIRFCLVQISSTTTNLLVTARIRYIKSVNFIIKQFVEGNAYSASYVGLKDLNNRLNSLMPCSTNNQHLTNSEVLKESNGDVVHHINHRDSNPVHQSFSDNNRNKESSDLDTITFILIFLVGILSIIHMYLYMKINRADFLLDTLIRLSKQ